MWFIRLFFQSEKVITLNLQYLLLYSMINIFFSNLLFDITFYICFYLPFKKYLKTALIKEK